MGTFEDSVKDAVQTTTDKDPQAGKVTSKAKTQGKKVASSIYEVKPNEDISVADGYGKRTINAINGMALAAKEAADDLFSKFTIFGEAADVLREAKQQVSETMQTVKEAKRQVEEYTGLNLSSVPALKASLQNGAITTIANASGLDKSSVFEIQQNTAMIAEGVSNGDVSLLLDATARVTGFDAKRMYRDIQTESAIFGELLGSAVGFGVTNIFDDLYDRVVSNDRKYGDNTAQRVIANNLDAVLMRGDFAMLRKLAEKSEEGFLIGQKPTLFTDMLNNYRIPYGKEVKDYPELAKDIIETFNLIDSTWIGFTENGKRIARCDAFLRPSKGARDVLYTSNNKEIIASMTIGDAYKMESSLSIMVSRYPSIAL